MGRGSAPPPPPSKPAGGRVRRWFRLALRVVLGVVVLAVLYVGATFAQVWRASGHDHRAPAEAIIVLGAAQYDGSPSPALRARLDHAVELWREGVAPIVVVTGGKQTGDRFTEAAASFAYLRDEGIPEANILREEQGTNTWEQLAAATRFLRDQGMSSAVLVSADYHAYRLDRIADELGLEAQVSPVDSGLGIVEQSKAYVRETAAVAVGRVIGFRRLVNLDESISAAT